MNDRRLVVTPGMGIGPEVTLRAVAEVGAADLVLFGRMSALEEANKGVGLWLEQVEQWPQAGVRGIPVLDPGDGEEPTEVAAIRQAARASQNGQVSALVTGPIHKKKLSEKGFSFLGHTDFLGALCGGQEPVMAFVGQRLRVALVTAHMPVAEVPQAITPARVLHTIVTAAQALRDDLGVEQARVLVCGLNPHAGEGGLLGSEDQEHIAPAVERARAAGFDVQGPVSAETAFMEAMAGRADLVVAMYHDQALVPLKVVEHGKAINWTLGLPIVRTSVDHGTAYGLVGTGKAKSSSMVSAIRLARNIVARRV